MNNYDLSIGAAYGRLPEPFFLLEHNCIVYRNPAAAALLPDLQPGEAVPEVFALLEPESAACLTLAGQSWSALLWVTGDLQIIRLEKLEDRPILPDHRISYLVQQLRSPLSSLVYTSDSLENQLPEELLARLSRPLARSRKAQHRLLRMMRTLELASLPDGTEPYDFHPQNVDLTGLLRETLRELEPLGAMLNCSVLLQDHTKNLCALCDDALIQTLIFHLVGNALRSAGQGGRIALVLEQKKDLALISVEDDGAGISPEILSTLFRPDQGGATLSDPAHGLGLGLTVCRKIAQLHGGSLMLVNREKRGVRATFSLKLASPGAPLFLHSPRLIDSNNGVRPVLRELSDVLPEQCYLPEI